jgi:hypothetical protein
MPVDDKATMERLDDQINWYDAKAASNRLYFKMFKIVGIGAAALIPLLAAFHLHAAVAGALGALVVALEGIQQLNQYHANWIAYRATSEALKHEKYLYLARAADYASAGRPTALLAERIESLVSQEHAKWASTLENAGTAKEPARAVQPPGAA